jgi:hypothetical protein
MYEEKSQTRYELPPCIIYGASFLRDNHENIWKVTRPVACAYPMQEVISNSKPLKYVHYVTTYFKHE